METLEAAEFGSNLHFATTNPLMCLETASRELMVES